MSADLYTAPQHVGLTHVAQVAPEATLAAPGGRSMQDRASELPRIPLLRASVNKAYNRGRRTGACAKSPAPLQTLELSSAAGSLYWLSSSQYRAPLSNAYVGPVSCLLSCYPDRLLLQINNKKWAITCGCTRNILSAQRSKDGEAVAVVNRRDGTNPVYRPELRHVQRAEFTTCGVAVMSISWQMP